ncbi:MAG: DinB family protein [Aureliella sp.]
MQMDAKAALKSSFNLSSQVLKAYVGDLDDADLMQRPGEGCNHIAYQLGHLISSEVQLLSMIAPEAAVELPDGFVETHAKENAACDDAAQFCSKEEYLALFDKVREASLSTLDSADDAMLEGPAPEPMQSFCPTNCDFYGLIASHPMMHAGQFVPVRRMLGKPIVM